MTSNLQMNMPELRVKTPNALEYNFIKWIKWNKNML
jgi:hypothetical protein